MRNLPFNKVNELMLKKYKANVINKQQFKNAIYGTNRKDLDDNISNLTEGIINSENAVFYLVNDVDTINKNCKWVYPQMYLSGQTIPMPLSGFMPYILFVAELSDDKKYMINYAKWGSFADNIFDELHTLEKKEKQK